MSDHKHKFKLYGRVRDFYGSRMYIFECSVCSVKPLVSKSDLYDQAHDQDQEELQRSKQLHVLLDD